MIQDIDDYVRYLENYPAEIKSLHNELLIGVTQFFRDPEAFAALGDRWLPELLGQAQGREVRFWVAGCSTGEEAYSLAMLAHQTLTKLDKRLAVKVFATDIDNDAIVRAGNGIYPESVAADLPYGYVSKYFVRQRESLQISRELREMVVFAKHDLLKDPPFTNITLASCRNLLIYLQPVLQKRVMEFLNFSLNPNGILFLGSSESAGDMVDRFQILDTKWKILRAQGKRYPANFSPDVVGPLARKSLTRAAWVSTRAASVAREDRVLERFLEGLSREVLPASLIVQENNEVLHTFGAAGDLLRISAGPLRNDITKLAHPDLAIPLATGIQRALQKNQTVRYTNVTLAQDDTHRRLQVRIFPLPGRSGQERLAAVLFEDARPSVPTAEADAADTYDVGREAGQRIADLEQELQFTRENLQATIEELETTNEELQATNEELLASNEELQSTNEELQSVNEELHTINAEHQSRILELAEVNNDLNNFVAAAPVATLFLDENLDIRRFTPSVADVFDINDNDLGRSFNKIRHTLDTDRIAAWIERVCDTGQALSRTVSDLNGKTYFLGILPYRIAPNVASGVSLTFMDISELRAAKDELGVAEAMLSESRQLHRFLLDAIGQGILVVRSDGNGAPLITEINAVGEKLAGFTSTQVVGRRLDAVLDTTVHGRLLQAIDQAAERDDGSLGSFGGNGEWHCSLRGLGSGEVVIMFSQPPTLIQGAAASDQGM